MEECTKRYGYDPEAGSKLGSNVLGPGEREWRGCVYEGIEKYLIPRTLSPDVYQRAIAEDRKMTEAIAKGEMTRAQRQARVQQMFEEIDRMEEANRAKHDIDRLEMEMRQDGAVPRSLSVEAPVGPHHSMQLRSTMDGFRRVLLRQILQCKRIP
jgi:hypothetical protein